MFRFCLLLLVVVALRLTGPGTARGDDNPVGTLTPTITATPTASPTATPTAALAYPNGKQLLAAMKAAVMHARTVHVTGTTTSTDETGAKQIQSTVSDLEWPHNLLHSAITLASQGPQKQDPIQIDQRVELEIAGKNSAWRSGRLSWVCNPKQLHGYRVSTAMLALRPKITAASTVGQSTLHATPTWEVKATGTMSGTVKGTLSADYLIAQNSKLVLRVEITALVDRQKPPQQMVEKYSKYGKSVKVMLPLKCELHPYGSEQHY